MSTLILAVAALIPELSRLQRLIAVDPNEQLLSGYNEISKHYKPDNFELVIHCKPMEDCSVDELAPKNRKNQLMVTCPPYFRKEIYPGTNQSTSMYADYTQWKKRFLYTLVKQACSALDLGGIIAIQIGPDGSHNIPLDLMIYIRKCQFLQYVGAFSSRVRDNKMLVAKFTGEPDSIEFPLSNKTEVTFPKRGNPEESETSTDKPSKKGTVLLRAPSVLTFFKSEVSPAKQRRVEVNELNGSYIMKIRPT